MFRYLNSKIHSTSTLNSYYKWDEWNSLCWNNKSSYAQTLILLANYRHFFIIFSIFQWVNCINISQFLNVRRGMSHWSISIKSCIHIIFRLAVSSALTLQMCKWTYDTPYNIEVFIKQHVFYAVLRRVYPNRINLLWKQRKALAKNFISIQDVAPIFYNVYMQKNGYTKIMYLLVVYIWIYKVEFEECAYIFKCISAVNNDSCKIKAKCLHSFLLIL